MASTTFRPGDAANPLFVNTLADLVLHFPIQPLQASRKDGLGVAIINFNTAMQTLRCLESLRTSTVAPEWVVVLDNASSSADFELLIGGCRAFSGSDVQVYRSSTNLGFAAGSNFIIKKLLDHTECQFVAHLNNDAVAQPAMLENLRLALESAPTKAGLAGGRMHRLSHPDEVDTLGISLYASLMPADRKGLGDPYLGPTGGCCLMSRSLLEELAAISGYFFDPRFFCYCEDTDLVLRAVLLGYQPVYVDQLMALHEGQASSGGTYSAFITYHGIRNTVWMHAKLMPARLLVKYGLLLLLAHGLTVGRHILSGHSRVMWAVYRDALGQMKAVLQDRVKFLPHVRITWRQLDDRIAPRFYRQGYLAQVLLQLTTLLRTKFSKK